MDKSLPFAFGDGLLVAKVSSRSSQRGEVLGKKNTEL
jgi:hypothetical protein